MKNVPYFMSEVLNHFEPSLSNVYFTNPKTKFNRYYAF